MNRYERDPSIESVLRAALDGERADMWTAMPGIIISFDPATQTAQVQCALQIPVKNARDGSVTWTNITPLLDCPVFFPRGGGCTLTFPVAVGDECLVVFASRCIDAWWQSGGHKNRLVLDRTHNLSDGFVMLGFSSAPNVTPNINTAQVQLRSVDGLASISLNPNTKDVTVQTTGAATIGAATINLNGALNINGVPYLQHKHGGVAAGTDNSGVVL